MRLGVTAVLDLTAEFSETKPFRALVYRNIPILDLTAPSIEQLREMAAFIDEESRQGIVYIHCKIGYSRTAGAAAAYLLQTGKAASVSEAIEICGGFVRPSSCDPKCSQLCPGSLAICRRAPGKLRNRFSPRLKQSLLHNRRGL